MAFRTKRPIKFRSLFKEEAAQKDIQMDLRKMEGALQKIKMTRADKSQAARAIRDAFLRCATKTARPACTLAVAAAPSPLVTHSNTTTTTTTTSR